MPSAQFGPHPTGPENQPPALRIDDTSLPGRRQVQFSSFIGPIFWTWHPTNRHICVPAKHRCRTAPLQVPGLAVIIVGSRKDSQTYVRMKKKACADVGILSFETALPEDATEATVIAAVRKYNYHPGVHGILVQLPLPDRINEEKVLATVALEKDVDGFHPIHVGQLCMKACVSGRSCRLLVCWTDGMCRLLHMSLAHPRNRWLASTAYRERKPTSCRLVPRSVQPSLCIPNNLFWSHTALSAMRLLHVWTRAERRDGGNERDTSVYVRHAPQ
jgi:hypothetical protein